MRLVNLIKARKIRGLTQTDVGKLIGKSQSHYAKIERGEIDFSAREALSLCDFFNISLKKLLSSKEMN